jgi:hypothetical protein
VNDALFSGSPWLQRPPSSEELTAAVEALQYRARCALMTSNEYVAHEQALHAAVSIGGLAAALRAVPETVPANPVEELVRAVRASRPSVTGRV